MKNGRRAPISPTGEMWWSQDSKRERAKGPAEAGPKAASANALDGGGIRRLVGLQMPDHVGDVGDLLLEVALILLQAAKPFLAARKAAVAAEAWAPAEMSVTVHVHLLSQRRMLIHQIGPIGQLRRTRGPSPRVLRPASQATPRIGRESS